MPEGFFSADKKARLQSSENKREINQVLYFAATTFEIILRNRNGNNQSHVKDPEYTSLSTCKCKYARGCGGGGGGRCLSPLPCAKMQHVWQVLCHATLWLRRSSHASTHMRDVCHRPKVSAKKLFVNCSVIPLTAILLV